MSTVEKISDAALQILEAEGQEAVTMRAVAERVGITPMAIYHHFSSRADLLQSVTESEFQRVLAYYQARLKTLSPKAGVMARLLALMHGQIDYAIQRPKLFDYYFSSQRPDARRFPEDFEARRSPTMNPVADGVRAAMAAGYLRQDNPWEVAMQLTALTHGFLVMYLGGRFNFSEDEFRAFCERAMGRLLAGLSEPRANHQSSPARSMGRRTT